MPQLFNALPEGMKRSETWGGNQGTEHLHHVVTPYQQNIPADWHAAIRK